MTNGDTYERAAKVYEEQFNLDWLQEECAELITAINHLRRGKKGAREEFLKEFIDVDFTMRVVKHYIKQIDFDLAMEAAISRSEIRMNEIELKKELKNED